MNLIRRSLALGFLADAEGAVSTEHALLLTLIAVAVMGAMTLFGSTVSGALFAASNTLLPFGS